MDRQVWAISVYKGHVTSSLGSLLEAIPQANGLEIHYTNNELMGEEELSAIVGSHLSTLHWKK